MMKSCLLMVAAAIALVGCESSQPISETRSPAPISTSTPLTATEQAIAKVSLIEEKPVFVLSKKNTAQKSTASTDEIDAKVNMGLYLADTIRTQGKGRTQVDFNNGVGFRISGDSILQIQPNNRLNLQSGRMITWVRPGLKVPTEISTSVATAAIRGTTAFVEIPKDINQGIRFFSWEGTVVVKLANQSQEIVLTTGEEVIVKPNFTSPPVVRRLSLEEWKTRSKNSPALRSFNAPLPTQSIIDKLVPGQSSVDQIPQVK